MVKKKPVKRATRRKSAHETGGCMKGTIKLFSSAIEEAMRLGYCDVGVHQALTWMLTMSQKTAELHGVDMETVSVAEVEARDAAVREWEKKHPPPKRYSPEVG